MKVREMIESLKYPTSIELKNSEDKMICLTVSNSEGIEPYLEREVESWHLFNPVMGNPEHPRADVYIKLKAEEAE